MADDDTVSAAAPRSRGPALKIWELTAKDRNEPPFHYTDAPHTVMVIAADEQSARQHAAASDPTMAPAGFMVRAGERVAVDARSPWLDEDLTTCVEADLSEPRVIALDNRA